MDSNTIYTNGRSKCQGNKDRREKGRTQKGKTQEEENNKDRVEK